MKKYFEYMDDRKVSDTLHQRLLKLEAPRKRPAAWKKYSAVAAALVLVCGIGGFSVWAAGVNGRTNPLPVYPSGDQAVPELADESIPDIAVVEPGDVTEPGMKTIGGYEVRGADNGPDTVVAYYMLPYIEYGTSQDVSAMSLDWDVPPGCTKRDLTGEDFAALFCKEENLSFHLGWTGYTLTGWAAWNEDGSLWGMFLYGYKGPMDHFEFAFLSGDMYPPTCIAYGDGKVNELWWDTPVTAYGHDGEYGCSRRVEFLKGGYGFRFDITGTDVEATDFLVSRLVRYLCDYSPFGVGNGFAPDAVTSDGAVLAHPWEADPGSSVGEPNWEDSEPAPSYTVTNPFPSDAVFSAANPGTASVPDYDSDCPYCGDGTVHTHPYDPQEAADPSYNAPAGQLPDSTNCD